MTTMPSELVERFHRICRDTPDRALVHLPSGKRSLSAQVLRDASRHLERVLARIGIGAGDLVICAAGNRPDVLALWVALRSLDAVLMPAEAGTTGAELQALARRFGATLVIVPRDVPGADDLGEIDGNAVPGLGIAAVHGAAGSRSDLRDAAVLKLTSGSTGLPKAACTTEPQLLDDAAHITTAMDIRPDDCQIAAIPLSHAYGIGNLVLPLLLQGTPIVLRDGFVPHQVPADVRAYGARMFPGVPFMFEHFANHLPPGAWPPRLERLVSAGARLEQSTARCFHDRFGVKVHSFYGASETGGIAYDDSPGPVDDGAVGRPMPGVTIELLPEDGAPAGAGRIHVASGAVAAGYAGEDGRGEGFTSSGFLTGDFGRFDGHGHLVLAGRVSAFINVAGRKVQPDEVEAVLREMPGVADVRVVGAWDRARGQQIVACIVARGSAPQLLDVRRFCASRLAAHKLPRTVVHLDSIPLTARGKTDRARLQAIVDGQLRGVPGAGVL